MCLHLFSLQCDIITRNHGLHRGLPERSPVRATITVLSVFRWGTVMPHMCFI